MHSPEPTIGGVPWQGFITYLNMMYYNIKVYAEFRDLSSRYYFIFICRLPHACYLPWSTHLHRSVDSNNIRRRVQMIKQLPLYNFVWLLDWIIRHLLCYILLQHLFSDGTPLQYSLSIGVTEGNILCVWWSCRSERDELLRWGTVSLHVNESIGQIAVGAKMWLQAWDGLGGRDTCIQWLKPRIILLWICANLRMTWSSISCGLWCITLALEWNEYEGGYG